jgi:hypothetical protein
MNPLTLEWEQKAEGDYAAAQWLQQAANPIHDAIVFGSLLLLPIPIVPLGLIVCGIQQPIRMWSLMNGLVINLYK